MCSHIGNSWIVGKCINSRKEPCSSKRITFISSIYLGDVSTTRIWCVITRRIIILLRSYCKKHVTWKKTLEQRAEQSVRVTAIAHSTFAFAHLKNQLSKNKPNCLCNKAQARSQRRRSSKQKIKAIVENIANSSITSTFRPLSACMGVPFRCLLCDVVLQLLQSAWRRTMALQNIYKIYKSIPNTSDTKYRFV